MKTYAIAQELRELQNQFVGDILSTFTRYV